MKDFGIKISKKHHDVFFLDGNNENPNLSFTSKYDVLKVAKVGSGTFNSGTPVTIAHGLGEPKAFITYLSTDNTNWNIYDGRSYIDDTNLVIAKDRDTTINYYYPEASNNVGRKFSGNWLNTYMAVGKTDTDLVYDYCAMRFPGVDETSDIDSAEIGFYIGLPSPRSGSVNVDTYGLDEDNVGDLGGDPGGVSRTSAHVANSCDNSITEVWAYGVTDIFKEIAGRAGWSSGNAMGFILLNNSNDTGHYIYGSYDNGSYLKVTKTSASQTIYYRYVIFENKLDSTKTI